MKNNKAVIIHGVATALYTIALALFSSWLNSGSYGFRWEICVASTADWIPVQLTQLDTSARYFITINEWSSTAGC
jgi:hypothetical protein